VLCKVLIVSTNIDASDCHVHQVSGLHRAGCGAGCCKSCIALHPWGGCFYYTASTRHNQCMLW
jgi:hypothetical protein